MKNLKETTKKNYHERMLTVLQYIHQHLDEQISLEKLAELAYFSPYHFHRIFRGMVGESLKSYIRRLRLERAASRLKYGKQSVIQIAFEAGYETHEAFTRAFGDMFGIAPRDYRLLECNDRIQTHSDSELLEINTHNLENTVMKVDIVEFQTMNAAYTRHIGPYNECCKSWEKLCTWAGPQGLIRPNTLFLGLCYDDPEVTPPEKIRYDACISIQEEIEPEGDIGTQTIDGGCYAMTTHFGPYEKLITTYAKLCGEWITGKGYEIASKPSIEIYQNSPEDTEPEDLITDIHVPLETK